MADDNNTGLTRAQGRRKSEFPAQAVPGSDSSFDFVSGGVNYKIPIADLITALGATGTIVQAGAVTSVPVLDPQGSVNNIRNLKPGAGIDISVNAQNGIDVKHAFTQDAIGVPVTRGLTLAAPAFASLVEGTGIGLVKTDDKITITATGTGAATKAVTVNTEGDFPTAVSGVITLAANTAYVLSNTITTASRFVLSNNTSIVGYSPLIAQLTYTGAGNMFSGVDANTFFTNIRVLAASGTVFNFSESAGGGLTATHMDNILIVDCLKVGTFATLRSLGLNDVVMQSGADGISVAGSAWDGIAITNFDCTSTDAGFIGIDLGTAVSDSVSIGNLLCNAPSGAVGVSGAASSANISAGGQGALSNSNFTGAVTPVSGISPSTDVRWTSIANEGIPDSRVDALLSMQGNATDTVIAGAGTPVLVAGTWVVELNTYMTGTTAGRITYIGERGVQLPIVASLSMEPASGGSVTLSAQVAVNGSVIANSKRTGAAASGSPTSITVPWQQPLATNDFVEIWVANEDNTVDVLVSAATFQVN